MAEPIVLSLRRSTSDKTWGFALQGGADQGLPVFVHKVTRNGIAHKSGLEPGDVIIKICETPVMGFSHAQVKAEILRAGNDLDFAVKKREFNVAAYNQTMQQLAAQANQAAAAAGVSASAVAGGAFGQDPRSEIVEEHLWKHGGPTFKNVQPKSYKILEQQLPQAQTGGPAPSSVFEREHAERSPYLQANEQSIQKAYGES